MTNQTQPTERTFWQNLGRLLRALIRLLLFALVIALVTAGIYFAIPYIYRYTMLPVQNNRAVIEHLRQTQTQMRDELNSQLAEQRERIAQLEIDLAAEREARSELEARVAQQEEEITAQASLSQRLEAQEQAVATLDQQVAALGEAVANVEQIVVSPESEVASLHRQTLILQMNQILLKTRLHLAENNAGQAQLALREADQVLANLSEVTPAGKQKELADLQSQLEAVRTAIEEKPFTALQELEILWQLLQEF